MLAVFYSLLLLIFFCYDTIFVVCRKILFVHMKVKIIICLIMISFFLVVAGRNMPSPPPLLPSPDVHLDDPPLHPILPPPSSIANISPLSSPISNYSNVVPQHSSRDMLFLNLYITVLLIIILVLLFFVFKYWFFH